MASWRVYCQALRPIPGTHIFCDFPGGTRKGVTKADAEAKPCPRCGGLVTAFEHEPGRPRRRAYG